MFQKVLISDDLDSITQGVAAVLEGLGVPEIIPVKYCDDAYLKIKKAEMDEVPFDLLITDLSFKLDHREQRFHSGEDLIRELRRSLPDLSIIAYSVEDRPMKLRKLMNGLEVNGFVNKGRNGLKELEECIHMVGQGEQYLSPELDAVLRGDNPLEFDDYEAMLLDLLSKGQSQEEISEFFRENGISPSSLSSIEKRLNKLRTDFKASNVVHLVSIVKDLGLI